MLYLELKITKHLLGFTGNLNAFLLCESPRFDPFTFTSYLLTGTLFKNTLSEFLFCSRHTATSGCLVKALWHCLLTSKTLPVLLVRMDEAVIFLKKETLRVYRNNSFHVSLIDVTNDNMNPLT